MAALQMTCRHILLLAACLSSLIVPPLARAADKKPNIVFILADDLGFADVSFNGRTEWTTPNLHRLVNEGTVFRRWYTSSVICAPSRAALMTGRYGIHNGVIGNGSLDLPSSEVTIAEVLKQNGYATALFGKWHAGAPRPGTKEFTHPMDQGFDEFFGFTSAVHAWQKFPKELWDGREKRPSEGYADDLFTDRAVDFIKRHKDPRSAPFFLYVPYICPHGKPGAPQEEIDAFKGKFHEINDEHPSNAMYAAEIVRMDKEVGRILKALEANDLNRSTLVVFTSDHGATFEKLSEFAPVYFDSNRPFRGQKRTLWEGGTRVPAIVRWTGTVPSRRDTHEIVHMTDVFPTLLAAAGITPDENLKLDGANLLDLWKGKAKSPERTLYWEWRESGDIQYAALKGDLKLVVNATNKPELYNVELDPGERRNLADQFPKIVKEMKQGLDAWLATETEAAKQRKSPGTRATAPTED
jgi:arylsulfatase A-like enzyme